MRNIFLFMIAFCFSLVMLDPSRILCCEAMLGLGIPKAEAASESADMPCHGMVQKKSPVKNKHAGEQCRFGATCAKCIPLACLAPQIIKPAPEFITVQKLRPAGQDFTAYIVELSTPPPKAA